MGRASKRSRSDRVLTRRDLRQAIGALEERLAREIRTRRVVVESGGGFPCIVLAADERGGQVVVRTRTPDAQVTCAELFADELDGGGSHVGVALTRDGDVVAVLECAPGRDPELWLDQEGGR